MSPIRAWPSSSPNQSCTAPESRVAVGVELDRRARRSTCAHAGARALGGDDDRRGRIRVDDRQRTEQHDRCRHATATTPVTTTPTRRASRRASSVVLRHPRVPLHRRRTVGVPADADAKNSSLHTCPNPDQRRLRRRSRAALDAVRRARTRATSSWSPRSPRPASLAPYAVALAADVVAARATAATPSSAPGASSSSTTPRSRRPGAAPSASSASRRRRSRPRSALDPFLAEVAWSWLVDALDARGAEYTAASGTATKILSTRLRRARRPGRRRPDRAARVLDAARARRRRARRRLGRAALHARRPPAGAEGVSVRHVTIAHGVTDAERAERPPTVPPSTVDVIATRGLAGPSSASRPAPARSPSTPSAPPASATRSAPT